jgi:hypothetical protein
MNWSNYNKRQKIKRMNRNQYRSRLYSEIVQEAEMKRKQEENLKYQEGIKSLYNVIYGN